ncbi:hypothetical protein [Neisseria sp. WF04]|uniref:hypothetical protein n=1 Tax=Neisseria sp. WF04 TaxID=2558283 RepID=UPI00142FBB4F|nr:hypothetical protein [Neisseria sp. WF04]
MKIPAIWKYRQFGNTGRLKSFQTAFASHGKVSGRAAAENFGLLRFAQDFLQGNAAV